MRYLHALLTTFAALGPSIRAGSAAPAALQETAPRDGDVADESASQEPTPTITAADRETLELLRDVLSAEGDEAARAVLREIVETLPEPQPGEEEAYLAFLRELDRFAAQIQSLEDSLILRGSALELTARIRAPHHDHVLVATLNLAQARHALGDFAGASELEERALQTWTPLLAPDHPYLLVGMEDHSLTLKALGDLAGARALQEQVLVTLSRKLPPGDPEILRMKSSLGSTMFTLGDVGGAHEIFETVLETRSRLLPADHPSVLSSKVQLAATRAALGDLAGARELEEAVLAIQARTLPPYDPEILMVKQNLGFTRRKLGDFEGARELEEAVLAERSRLLPPEHPDVLEARQNLAATRAELGDLEGARELEEMVLAARLRQLPPGHPDVVIAQQNLAVTKYQLGDLEGAHELFEAVCDAQDGVLPADHPWLLSAQANLAGARYLLGDLAGAHEVVARLLDGLLARARALRAEAARPAREGARTQLHHLSEALSLGLLTDPEHRLEPRFLATLESLRLASVASWEVAHALSAQPELAAQAGELARLRSELNDLAVAGPPDGAAAEAWRTELVAASEARDRAERQLRKRLAEAGAFAGELDASAIATRLAPQSAAASFLRYAKESMSEAATGTTVKVDSLVAFVVRADASVRRVELGAASELETLARDWRASLGKPIERGVAAAEAEGRSETELGRALRARLLDPVLAAAGEDVSTLHVVLDDLLFLVPLDALPLDALSPEEDERVGERVSIHVEPTLARLLHEKRAPVSSGTLVALGGIDFDAQEKPEREEASEEKGGAVAASAEEPAEESDEPAGLPDAPTPPLERTGRPESFAPLRQTGYEIEDVGAQFAEALDGEALLLEGGEATKVALHAAAPRARFLHLATHGWFASESFRSQLDTSQRAEEALTAFAPETLCGLALAGANRGQDARGRVPGILTAEELASFDLRGCELAVLSACETNVGIRRAGQGIQSLQTALHAAGARTAITSLWKVDDAATRRLFELFYAKRWQEKLGKADALWRAKMALRAEGHPPRDWAGWVLSGDPE